MQQNSNYILEEWYNQLQSITIPSIFILLSQEQKYLLINLYETIYKHYFVQLNYKNKNNLTQQSFIEYDGNWIDHPDVKKQINLDVLQKLSQKITQNLKEGEYYFAKLSLRSPKDSLAIRKCKDKLRLQYPELQKQHLQGELQRLSLKVSNSKQIIQLLGSSQRIKDDLKISQKQQNYPVNLIIRQWRSIPSCLQFRIFMKSRKVTAISSYYKSEVHLWLLKYKNSIKQQIIQFFNQKIINQIPYEDGIFDIGFQLASKLYHEHEQIQKSLFDKNVKIMVIQVNPFTKQTGAALFSWVIDAKILESGPVQMRMSGEQN